MSRVLIVEDEPVLRRTFQRFLTEDGHDTSVVGSVDDALEALDASVPDVIVSDIIMPGKTGIDLLNRVRSREIDCPVIMITGEPNVETASQAVRLGAFDYLAKPVAGRELVRVVRQALERQRLSSERDRMARALEAQRRELAAIFESVSDGIVALDTQGRIRQINGAACAILGLRLAPQAGTPFKEVAPQDVAQALTSLEMAALAGQPAAGQRVEAMMADGKRRVLLVNATPVPGDSGVYDAGLLLLRDITQISLLQGEGGEGELRHRMIGRSAQMQELFSLIDVLAETDSTVLICGESGTGKELVAAALHQGSPRRGQPFVKVNCAALSEELLESELFGHVRGAFTGAMRDRVGRFELADGGTILLDEIGDISLRLQLRLLRVLEQQEFERVGDSTSMRTDVRIIASTNRDLPERIRAGEFREDLYYRLNVIRLDLPPLRKRKQDIPPLVDAIARRLQARLKKQLRGITPECLDRLLAYSWPGNVRELENCLERAFIVCSGTHIDVPHLPAEVLAETDSVALGPAPRLAAATANMTDERARLLHVLQATDWNIAKSARLLGRSRNTVYQRIRALRLERPEDSINTSGQSEQ